MAVSTGSSALDDLLGGGLPERRAVLVTGGPGAGKSVLGMQFLQAGLHAGDEGLLVATDQTPAEVRASFEGFAFDLDDPNLTVVSVWAGADGQLELDVAGGSAAGGTDPAGAFIVPFEFPALLEVLGRFDDCDRVVFDTATGLADLDSNPTRVHRLALDLIRLFSDRFEATSLLTAETKAPGVPAPLTRTLEHAAHGVVSLRDERQRGGRGRTIVVEKLRGVDHELRERAYHLTEHGLEPVGLERPPVVGPGEAVIPTGNAELDARCGGLALGGVIALEHDQRSIVDPLVVQFASAALSADMGLWLVPSPVLTPERFDALLPSDQPDVDALLETGRLYVLDLFSSWSGVGDASTVFAIPNNRLVHALVRSTMGMRFAKRVIVRIDRQRGDRPMFAPVYLDAFTYLLGDIELVRDLYLWARRSVTIDRDTAFYVYNPRGLDTRLAETIRTDADQLFEVTTDVSGHRFVHLGKTKTGRPGARVPLEATGFGSK